ncbi:hypothetical protein CS063_02140 [Sporanaerobium hydrogeniformans]|uniref:Uncharacterized protein n=1 Tax=Sporanaerobium hydrogeniformans TaxID=3072179 RepID=A0AC61DHM5_9FIRM|nr:HD domain-containing phosphohydrolase [Sporanaerobium hydrogeniformans]PHV72298.1 hypothetical protein CS063_02140 [Sporanaerobium hydrogeniformans]
MQKIIIPLSKCIPGMITAQPIVDLQTGTTILAQNVELTAEHIKDLSHFIHSDIWVYLDSFSQVWNLSPETIEKYKTYSNALNKVIKSANQDNSIDFETFEKLCEHLSIDFKDNHNLLGCTHLIKALSYDTYTHSLNVALLCMLISKWLRVDKTTLNHTIKAALLHDIGSINLSFDSMKVLKGLTPEEQAEYEKHPIYSYNIVSKMQDIEPVIAKAILAHHEHCDGSGFPIHIREAYLSTVTRILSIADTYEILMKQHHIFDTLKILLEDYITKLDPDKLLTFCNYIATYYIGVFVTLSNGQIGQVVFINPKCIYRPIIKINDKFINLYEDASLNILSIE